METDTHTISMAASKLSWNEIDKRANNLGFKNRSSYIQYLTEKDIYKNKIEKTNILIIVMFLEMSMITLALLLRML